VLVLLIDELHESGRYHEPALDRVREAVRQARDEARADMPGKSAAASLQRLARKLERVERHLEDADDTQKRRAWRWALDARVSRRASALKHAIDDAGAMYLQERVHMMRIALKKLRYGLELRAEAAGTKTTPDPSTRSGSSRASSRDDLRLLKRMQELLGRLHDLQVLIDRVRQVQASLTPPNVAGWRDLDTLVTSLEQTCRRLHARYVSDRHLLVDICERLVERRAAVPRVARRAS
jgi:CHAD domain-containing protein